MGQPLLVLLQTAAGLRSRTYHRTCGARVRARASTEENMDAKMPECCEPAFLLHRPPRELGLSDIREDRRERARKTAFFCGNFSQVKESLFAWKYASACILHKDDDLRIVHVKESPPAIPSVYARPTPVLSSRDLSSAEVRDWLPKTIEREAFLGSQIVSVVAEGGQSIGEAICKFLEDHKIDLAVLGRRDIGAAEELLLGSTSKSVANYAPCPVFTVRRPFYHFSDYSAELQPEHFVTKITRPRSVVIALDGHEELSSRVVTWALANCILCDDCIHIVSVGMPLARLFFSLLLFADARSCFFF